jgi:WD40 repeat protein
MPTHLVLSPLHNLMAIASADHKLVLHDLATHTRKSHGADEDHSGQITTLRYLDSLNIFATASTDGTTKIWDAENSLIR